MIIEKQENATEAVLQEMRRTPEARTREILASLVRHLHGFVREVRLTEREFQFGVTRALTGNFILLPDRIFSLEFTFVLEPGESRLPTPPITGKVAA